MSNLFTQLAPLSLCPIQPGYQPTNSTVEEGIRGWNVQLQIVQVLCSFAQYIEACFMIIPYVAMSLYDIETL